MNEKLNEILDKIDDELFELNIDAEIKSDKIIWKDNFGAENYINLNASDKYGENLAWWKFNEAGKDIVMFTKEDFVVTWKPSPLNNMGMSSECIYLKFCREILVVAYQDKHRQRVFSINTTTLEVRQLYHCGKIGVAIWNDLLFVKDYDRNECFSVNLHIPLLEKVKTQEQSLKSNHIFLHTSFGIDKF